MFFEHLTDVFIVKVRPYQLLPVRLFDVTYSAEDQLSAKLPVMQTSSVDLLQTLAMCAQSDAPLEINDEANV